MRKKHIVGFNVKGKKILSEEEFSNLVENGHYTHVLKHNDEMRSNKLITQPLSYDTDEKPWIYIDRGFYHEEDAISYARKMLLEGVDGSNAVIEKVEKKFLRRKLKYSVVCELKKETGNVGEIVR